jgi:hypothetical protein
MKRTILAILCGAVLAGLGCVSTVNDRTTPGVPFLKDKIEGRYERPVETIFIAAKDVMGRLGTLVNESTLYGQANTVKTVQGKVNQCNVFIRVEAIDPKVTAVTVQTRTPAGTADLDLAAQIEKEIALELK